MNGAFHRRNWFVQNQLTNDSFNLFQRQKINSTLSQFQLMGIWFGGPHGRTTYKGNMANSKDGTLLGYNLICELISANQSITITKDEANQMVAVHHKNKTSDEHFFVTYMTERGIANLMKFVVEENLAGVVAFLLILDDFEGTCQVDNSTFIDFNRIDYPDVPKRSDNRFPLLRTINEALYKAANRYNRNQLTAGSASSVTRNSYCVAVALLGIVFCLLSLALSN